MAWSCTVEADVGDTRIGTVTATYVDTGQFQAVPFVFSKRCTLAGPEAVKFKAEALAALALEVARRTQNAAQATALANFMNS
jgi:hypothetical protein